MINDMYAAMLERLPVWKGDPAAGLAALHEAAGDDPLIAAERLRLATPPARPPGWVSLWQLGETDLFRPGGTVDQPTIRMAARNDQGILSRPVALDLTAGTRLRWRWRILALPTAEAEDTVGTHDYTSIGVEFDAGRDLTYSWSAALPVGAAFRCPIRHWAERETHLVVRAGREGLGTWTDEERSVLADCAAVMGPPPARIVAVWLIAVSTFGHGTAIAEVSDIALVDGPDGSRSWAEPELSRASRPAPARGAAPPGAPRTPAGRRGR